MILLHMKLTLQTSNLVISGMIFKSTSKIILLMTSGPLLKQKIKLMRLWMMKKELKNQNISNLLFNLMLVMMLRSVIKLMKASIKKL